ncbi:serine hydrolase [Lysinibacillus sp. NPDC097195]|uniref:serine hydrolase n=1 Tax=Lysinibacillus sp. NPDC097195 TaxID=3364141 RepID=UPI0038186D0E
MFKKEVTEEDPEYILQFIKENLESEKVSLSINYNEQKWVEVNQTKLLPLASTAKIIIAIEYARQAANGKIDPQQEVSLEELNAFYVPKTDGGAHDAWIANLNNGKEVGKVHLSEVAKGMIAFSSNANTEYLMNVLGLQNINNIPESLGIFNHEPLYPIVSALFIPSQLMNQQNLTKQEMLEAMESMDITEYRKRAMDIHNKWLNSPPTAQEKKQLVKSLDMDIQKVWSDRLPRSTSEDYVYIMNILNNKTHFNEDIYKYLDPVMEQLMENPKNRDWLVHAGQKGGSTRFIVTTAMYATDKEGNQTEIAFFANDLTTLVQTKLSHNMNAFKLKFLQDAEFRTLIKNELSMP